MRRKIPAQPNMFAEFDQLFASMKQTCAEIDSAVQLLGTKIDSVTQLVRSPQRPNLPDWRTKDFHWSRDHIEQNFLNCDSNTPEYSVGDFLGELTTYAPLFIWNDTSEGQLLRGWDKQGYTYDPLTAVIRCKLGLMFSLCVCDLAGRVLGLTRDDALLVAAVCWNADKRVLTEQQQATRYLLIQAIDNRSRVDIDL